MPDTGVEKLRRLRTRILTQGTAGEADPPLPPPPLSAGSIFVMASFRIWDVVNPTAPEQLSLVDTPNVGFGRAIIKSSDTCWCLDNSTNFSSVDVSDEMAPVVLDQLLGMNPFGSGQGLALDGTTVYALIGGNGGGTNFLNAINGSDPSNLSITATYNLDSAFAVIQKFPRSIVNFTTTHRLYIVSAESGLNTVFSVYNATAPGTVTQQGTLTLAVAPAFSQACNLAINHPLIYAILAGNGTSIAAVLKIIDVTNPAAPSVLSTTTIGLVTDLMRKVQIDGTTLYIGGSTLNDSVGDPSKILTYDVSNSAAPSLSATLTMTGIARPLTSMFIRDSIAYVGSAGDSEASAIFSIWDLTTGLQSQQAFGFAAVSDAALTGDA